LQPSTFICGEKKDFRPQARDRETDKPMPLNNPLEQTANSLGNSGEAGDTVGACFTRREYLHTGGISKRLLEQTEIL
jgi:hypothetical protein